MKKFIVKLLVVAMILSSITGLSACYQDDVEPLTPYIGENGNWWIGDTDTLISATETEGEEKEASDPEPSFRFNAELNCYEVSLDGGSSWLAIENYTPVPDASEDDDKKDGDTEGGDTEGGGTEGGGTENVEPYEYPMNTITPVVATVAYATDHEYCVYNSTETAFIDLEGLNYDTVSFDIADDHVDPWVCFAFLTEMPEIGEVVKYAEGYSTFKFSCYDCTVDIPADAKYLVFYSSDGTIDYLPAKITFTKGKTTLDNLQDNTLDYYDFPMENLVADHGVIRYFDEADNKFLYLKDYKVAFIDITDTVFDYVILTPADREDKWMGYAFVTEMPEIGAKVSYAEGYNTFKSGNYEIEIPENAKYLVVYYMDSYSELYYPGAIRFEKSS